MNTSGTSSDFNAGLHGAAGLTLVLVKGMAVDVQGEDESVESVFKRADEEMYEAKVSMKAQR